MEILNAKLVLTVVGVLSFTLGELEDRRQIGAPSAHTPKKDKRLPRPYDGYKDSRKYFQYYPAYYGSILVKKADEAFTTTPFEQGFHGLYPKKVKWGDKNGGYSEFYFDLNHDEGDSESYDDNESDREQGEDGEQDDYHDDLYYKNKKKIKDVEILKVRHLPEDVEILPGYTMNKKAPKHGGNYKQL